MGSGVGDDEEGGLGQPQPLQARHQVAAHLRQDPGGDPVEHDADGGAPSRSVLQGRPGGVVAVARGGGDEEPQVGRLLEAQRQGPVGLVHGVEVGGVHEGQARGHGLGEDVAAHLRQRVLGEGLAVLRVHDQDGRARRGAQDPGLGELGAQDGVDQRGLTGAGRPAHDDDGGQVGVRQTRQHVVADLADEAGAQAASVGDAVCVQHELEPFQVPHGVGQDVNELGAAERRDRNVLPGGK